MVRGTDFLPLPRRLPKVPSFDPGSRRNNRYDAMIRELCLSVMLASLSALPLRAEQIDSFDYFADNRSMIRNGG